MIKLAARPDKPARLRGQELKSRKARLTRMDRKGISIKSTDFDPRYYNHLDIRNELWIWQNKKCCYCERHRDLTREPDVEHFRPKAEVSGEAHPGYWWLGYEWNNLYFSCRTCNQTYKKCSLPLEAGGIRAMAKTDKLSLELPTLVDFENEDPESLIGYYWEDQLIPLAKPVGRDAQGRGNRIIKILGLDRTELNEERGSLISSLKAQAETLRLAIQNNNHLERDRQISYLQRMTSSNQPFLGFRRFFFSQAGLGEYLAHG